jgi:molybdenum cofactor biosynthesis enzyme MoaA
MFFKNALDGGYPLVAKKQLSINVHLTDHCNLNCKSCEHFSSIADKKFIDLEKYEKDLARLKEISRGEISLIRLLGGEPLLFPGIIDAIKLTRKYFPASAVNNTTGGGGVKIVIIYKWYAFYKQNE